MHYLPHQQFTEYNLNDLIKSTLTNNSKHSDMYLLARAEHITEYRMHNSWRKIGGAFPWHIMLSRREQLPGPSISLPMTRERERERKRRKKTRLCNRRINFCRFVEGKVLRWGETRQGDGGTTRESVGKYRKRPDNGPRRPRLTFCSFIKPSGTRARAADVASRSQVTRDFQRYIREMDIRVCEQSPPLRRLESWLSLSLQIFFTRFVNATEFLRENSPGTYRAEFN